MRGIIQNRLGRQTIDDLAAADSGWIVRLKKLRVIQAGLIAVVLLSMSLAVLFRRDHREVVVLGHFPRNDIPQIEDAIQRFRSRVTYQFLIHGYFKPIFKVLIPDRLFGRMTEVGSQIDRSSIGFGFFMTNPISPAYVVSKGSFVPMVVEYNLERTSNSWEVTSWCIPK